MATRFKNIIRGVLGLAFVAISHASLAVSPEVAAVQFKLKAAYPSTPITSVSESPIKGIYEVIMGRNVAYTDDSGRYFFFGHVMDMKTQRDITEDRMATLTKIDVSRINKSDAFKYVNGTGARTLYVFADPHCGYCKALEKNLGQVRDVTIYVVPYPILGQESVRVANLLWCSSNREKAWHDFMLNGVEPAAQECETPVARNTTLGNSMNITGTPTLVFADGRMVPGAVPPDQIEKFLASAAGAN